MKRIAFIGLGHMGHPMVLNLIKAGYNVNIYDVNTAAMDELAARGAIPLVSLAECVTDADIIITMLQNGDQVKEVCMMNEGIFKNAKQNTLYIDSSSIDIATTLYLHAEAEKINLKMLDAPVSGGVAGAMAGTLTFMVGGKESIYLEAKDALEKMGKKIIHAGAASHGQAAKICNNLMLGISMIAVCEGFNLAEKLGLDTKKLFEISSNASAQCWSMTSYCPVPGLVESAPSNKNFEPGFMAKMMLKDLHLGESAAEHAGAAIPLGQLATQLYTQFVEQGNGELDFSGIIKMIAAP
ncbi:MAG: 3-hydroxyisobutyrate dehydrogenase [Gammaproteobacteria bacterium]|nr:3-hydroxyisobutyrate dehydrogenase [Gammaproteobacteria bacterium]